MRTSNSETQTFKRCRRKWWLAYYRQLTLRDRKLTGALQLGTRVHASLAGYYSGEGDPFELLRQSIEADRLVYADRGWEDDTDLVKEHELARIMLEGYFQWREETGLDQDLEIVAAEQAREVVLNVESVPVTFMTKLDLQVRRVSSGVRLFRDFKTVGNLVDPVKTLHMDEQMLGYQLVERLLAPEGEHVSGGLYTMLRKVKRTASATPPFYDQVEAHHNDEELRSYYRRLHGTIREILRLRTELDAGADHRHVAYPTPTRDCKWQCEFYPVCPMFDDGSNVTGLLNEYYTSYNPLERYDERTDDGAG